MKTESIKYSYTPNFQSTRCSVLDSAGRVINCHYTNLNRADVNWEEFVKLLDKRFQFQDKVRINLFGCSDGSDAYTLRLYLMKYLGKRASKFMIEASDISPQMVEEAKSGSIYLYDKDLEFLDSIGARQYFMRDYNTPAKTMRNIDFYKYKVHPELTDFINFTVKDVREEAKEHNFGNEVFIFRNGWTFMDLDTQNQIVKDLSKNCNPKTLCLIGQSDLFKSNACEFFQRNNFKGIDSPVFTRAETDYPSATIGIPPTKSVYPEFILFEKA